MISLQNRVFRRQNKFSHTYFEYIFWLFCNIYHLTIPETFAQTEGSIII